MCSSGTRGVPKAVVLPVSGDPYVLAGILKTIPWRKGMVVQQRATFFHAWGWLNLQLALATTSTLVLRQEFDPATDVADCRKYGVNALVSAPPFVDALITESIKEDKPIGPFKFIVSSGNKVPVSTLKKVNENFGPVMYSFYGSTEHGQISIADTADMLEDPTIVGKTPVGIGIKIITDDGHVAKTGEEGEVYSSNHMSMRGFLSPDDDVTLHDGLIDTGDRGYFDKQGRLHVAGRSDDMVIQGGENVHFEEINDTILEIPGVMEAFVWGEQNGMFAKITAYVVKDDSDAGKQVTEDDVRAQVSRNLTKHSVPENVVWLEDIPMNDAGKYVPREFVA